MNVKFDTADPNAKIDDPDFAFLGEFSSWPEKSSIRSCSTTTTR